MRTTTARHEPAEGIRADLYSVRRVLAIFLLLGLPGLVGCGDDDPASADDFFDVSELIDVDTGAVDSGALDAAQDVRDAHDGGQRVDASDVMPADDADDADTSEQTDTSDASDASDASDTSDAPSECVGTGALDGAEVDDDCSTGELGVCEAGIVVCDAQAGLLVCEQLEQPSAETCDGLDNDCDGDVDEDLFADCALQDGVCTGATVACTNGQYPSCTAADYGADYEVDETLCDGLDNDCDAQIDEGCTCTDGDQQPCYGGPAGTAGVGECQEGTQTCTAGAWGACTGEVTPEAEVCDGLDNDCDGDVDEALFEDCALQDGVCFGAQVACTNGQFPNCGAAEYGVDYEVDETSCDGIDNDCDGQDDEGCDCIDGAQQSCYSGPSGTAGVGQCQEGTQTCTGGAWGACTGEVTPSAEVCDDVDNDCDGQVDEGLFADCALQDGVCSGAQVACTNGQFPSCTASDYGSDYESTETSCDGADNDCDGQTDEGCTCTDGDQQSCYSGAAGTAGVGQCQEGTQTCSGGSWGACSGEVTPTAEICDGLDNDCDGDVDEALFADCSLQDGVCYGAQVACTNGQFPACTASEYGADYETTETSCDGLDNDCDGQDDEGCDCIDGDQQSCYGGPSGTAGVGQCQEGIQTCSGGAWGACTGEVTPTAEICDGLDNDCDGDVDEALFADCALQDGICYGTQVACTNGQFPSCGAAEYGADYEVDETSCDGLDNDCDGQDDEGCDCIDGNQQSCYSGPSGTAGVGQCQEGIQTCSGGAWGACSGEVTPTAEICDDLDNDCDGDVDEDLFENCALQDGVCSGAQVACTNGQFPACTASDYGSDYESTETSCDGADNDCDGQTDEGCSCIDGDMQGCYNGPAGTQGVGACMGGVQVCSGGAWGWCSGEVTPTAEVCDGADNDCDGEVDEGVLTTYYRDEDDDGWGVAGDSIEACSPTGLYKATVSGDCDDTDSDVYPGATEVCDDIDNDCDGQIDEGVKTAYYYDHDADGYGGVSSIAVWECSDPSTASYQYSTTNDDCDDYNPQVNPGHDEVCDNLDNNCSGHIDEADPALDPSELSTFYLDDDGDGFGTINETINSCFAPTGYVEEAGDCDDFHDKTYPGAAPNDHPDACMRDVDQDGWGDSNPPSGVVAGTDCDDSDASIHPGATEYCDGVDRDCSGNPNPNYAVDAKTWYHDRDGDGFAGTRQVQNCFQPSSDYYLVSEDCYDDPNDPVASDAYPGQTSWFTSSFPKPSNPTSFDWNCDDWREHRWTTRGVSCSSHTSQSACQGQAPGWTGSSFAACGTSANYLTGCNWISVHPGACVSNEETRTQECR